VTGVLGGAPWETDDRATIGRPFLGLEEVRLVRDDGSDAPTANQGAVGPRHPGRHPDVRLPGGAGGDRRDARRRALVAHRQHDVRHSTGRFEFRGREMHIIRRGGENLSSYSLEIDL
jgi:crotonobetaine/carnitine-CoA ligase